MSVSVNISTTYVHSCSGQILRRSMSMLQRKFGAAALLFVGLIAMAAMSSRAPAQQAKQQPAPAQPAAAEEPGDPQALPRRVAIRFLTDSDFPPFNYFDEDNVLTGFNVDVARAICLELAAACDIQVRAVGRAAAGAAAGRGRRRHRLARGQRQRAQGRRLHRPLLLHAGPLRRQARLRPPRRHARGPRGQEDRRRQGHRARGLPARVLPRQLDPRLRDAGAGPRRAHHRRRRPPVRRRHQPGLLAQRHRPPRPAASSRAARSASPSTSATASASPSTATTRSSRR